MQIDVARREPEGRISIVIYGRLRTFQSVSLIFVYRTTSKKWEGTYRYLSVEGEKVGFKIERARPIFRSKFVKP